MAVVLNPVAVGILRVAGLTVLSGLVAATVSIAYRWYFKDRIPGGVTLLAGVAAVAIYLNTRGALEAVAQGQAGYLALETVIFNTVAFLTAALITPVGLRVGDRIATSTVAVSGAVDVDGEVSRLVTTVGRRTAVTLPETIEDLPEHDPVPSSVTEQLAGRTFLFPRGLTVAELHDRLVTRLKADYSVGHVDVELGADGTVEYLGLGQRVAGLGPTLAPGTGAVAIRADPPNAASPGDLVQVWDVDGDEPTMMATGELRGVVGDVLTLAVGDRETRQLAGGSYRVLTLPSQARPEHEFAGLLRAADETMATVEVTTDSSLDGTTIRDLGATVAAVKPTDGPIEPVPARSRTITGGDRLYLVARPEVVRRIEAASAAT